MFSILRSFGFKHGVHPPELKDATASLPIRRLPFPSEVVLPLRQHAGKAAKLIVKVGDYVLRGDVIAEADGFVSAPVHASATGTVASIGLSPHPDGSTDIAVRIKVAPFSAQVPRPRLIPHWEQLSSEGIVRAVRECVPTSVAVGIRVSATDWIDGGWDVPQTIELINRGGMTAAPPQG